MLTQNRSTDPRSLHPTGAEMNPQSTIVIARERQRDLARAAAAAQVARDLARERRPESGRHARSESRRRGSPRIERRP
jgi:hypothetical protein